jgi:hypothetical protein
MDLTSISYELAIIEIDISNKRIVELSGRLALAVEELAQLREELDAARSAISVKQATKPEAAPRIVDRPFWPRLTERLGRLLAIERRMGAPDFHIDRICGKPPVAGRASIVSKKEHRLLSISGWAVPSKRNRPFDWIGIELHGNPGRIFKKAPVADRPDVAIHFANPVLAAAGFTVEFALSELAAGSYAIKIVGGLSERAKACASAGTVEID